MITPHISTDRANVLKCSTYCWLQKDEVLYSAVCEILIQSVFAPT